jgi:hypothetical protein
MGMGGRGARAIIGSGVRCPALAPATFDPTYQRKREQGMQISYETTAADQIAKLERYAAGSPHARWFPPAAYAVICGLAWIAAYRFFTEQPDHPWRSWAAAGLATSLMLALPWLYRVYQSSFFASVVTSASLRGIIGSKTLTLTPDHVEESGGLLTVRCAWSDAVGIERQDARTLILLAPMLAIAVPASAFPDSDARRLFEEQVERHLAEAAPPA